MEGQSFGLAPRYGGRMWRDRFRGRSHVRPMPGRLRGGLKESEGQRDCADEATRRAAPQHMTEGEATFEYLPPTRRFARWAKVYLTLLGKEGN